MTSPARTLSNRPMPNEEATPGQRKAILNCLAYKTGGLPSQTYLDVEGETLEQWQERLIEHHTGQAVSLSNLDRRTASTIIASLIEKPTA